LAGCTIVTIGPLNQEAGCEPCPELWSFTDSIGCRVSGVRNKEIAPFRSGWHFGEGQRISSLPPL